MKRAGVVLAGALVVGSVAMALGPTAKAPVRRPRESPTVVVAAASPAVATAANARVKAPAPRPPSRSQPARAVDPVLAAVSAGVEARAMLLDVASLRGTRLARMLVACLPDRDRRELARLRDEVGWDPLETVDRFAGSDRVLVLEGRFAGVRWQKLHDGLEAETRRGVTIFRREHGEQLAAIGDRLLVVGRDAEALDDALARLDGRVRAEPMAPAEADLWGRTKASDLLDPLSLPGDVSGPLGEMLDDAGLTAGIRVHFGDDSVQVALDIDAPGIGASLVTEALAAALDAARGLAPAEPDQATTAAVLSDVRVDTSGDGVDLRLDLGAEAITRLLGSCAHDVP